MNIKILDSWLREYLKTKATSKQIGEMLSLTSVSVERIIPYGKNDFIYDIEITTNRPDLMSVVGLAREAATILPQFTIAATFSPPQFKIPVKRVQDEKKLIIKNNNSLVHRICAVVMDITQKESPSFIKERLEASDIRTLNNLIDVTNYVMRETGHPAHVFDYDRLKNHMLLIREAKKGEKIVTLDKKEHILQGGDIVADNGKGKIIDLLGIMGTFNSVVTNDTKRIIFFLDNNDAHKIRNTSMSLGIRSEAAILNEKGVDPELTMDALLRGIELYKEVANGKIASQIIDIYPNKYKPQKVTVRLDRINEIIGITITAKKAATILKDLGFSPTEKNNSLEIQIPSWRSNDVTIEEDIIEEIARVYGYHRLPSIMPGAQALESFHLTTGTFYWETRVKNALKYWGFTETYTYSLVSEELLDGPTDEAVKVKNPLSEDLVYLRKTLVPSLLQVIRENKKRDTVKIFEISNVYHKKPHALPDEIAMLAGVIKKKNVSFYEIKGVIEQLLTDIGMQHTRFTQRKNGELGADVYSKDVLLGNIEVLDDNLINFELNFETIIKHATMRKVFKSFAKYPPIIEDIAIIASETTTTGELIDEIKKQSVLITSVSLLDQYENTRTFHILYQHKERNLTNEEIGEIRKKILSSLEKKYNVILKK